MHGNNKDYRGVKITVEAKEATRRINETLGLTGNSIILGLLLK